MPAPRKRLRSRTRPRSRHPAPRAFATHEGANVNKRIYSLIWNRSRNQVVVASELASGKSVAAARGSAAGGPKLAVLAVALAMMIAPSAMAGEPATRVSQDGSLAAVRYDVLDLQFNYFSHEEPQQLQPAGSVHPLDSLSGNCDGFGFESSAGNSATACGYFAYANANYSSAFGGDSNAS